MAHSLPLKSKTVRFIGVIETLQEATDHKTVWLGVQEPESLLHMPLFLKLLCSSKDVQLVTLSVREKSLHEIKAILESSFLGQSKWYLISDLEQHAKNSLVLLINYLLDYNGPHRLMVCYAADFVHAGLLKKATVEVPAELSIQQVIEWGLPVRVCNPQTVQTFFSGKNTLSLTALLSSLPYLSVLGRSLIPSFQESYLPRLVKAEAGSLFSFSDLFWQKKTTSFYEQWAHLKGLYAPQFWISFWSDQFFRAATYAACMRAKEHTVAQQIAARKLSFWYIKSGWQKIDINQLAMLHDMLYTIDYRSKTGSDTEMIEHIYQRWFSRSS